MFIDYVLKQFENIEQKRSGGDFSKAPGGIGMDTTCAQVDEKTCGSDILAKYYILDAATSETFDSETLIIDALNPFDIDTQLSRLYAQLASPHSAFAAATSSPIMRRREQERLTEQYSHTPLVSTVLYARQLEHQRGHLILPKLFDFLILLSHEKKVLSVQSTTPNRQGYATNSINECKKL